MKCKYSDDITYTSKINKDAVVYVTCIKDWQPDNFNVWFRKNHVYKFYPQYSTIVDNTTQLEFYVGLKYEEYFKKKNIFITAFNMLKYG